jgi:hypothetical protein
MMHGGMSGWMDWWRACLSSSEPKPRNMERIDLLTWHATGRFVFVCDCVPHSIR